MPWRETSVMAMRAELVSMIQSGEVGVGELAWRFGVSRKTAYKWCARARAGQGMGDRSRRPHSSPARCSAVIQERVVALRGEHPAWGARKLHRRLQDLGCPVPAVSTVNAILRRQGLIDAQASARALAFTRFEHAYPNDLWQMDFKGHFAMARGRCHALTVLDDHSRFNLVLGACADEREATVRGWLMGAFRRYGLPRRMTMDNGSPWGAIEAQGLTGLTVWLIRLGVGVSHSSAYHPQTQGKDERFHRTLAAEVLGTRQLGDLLEVQTCFDRWRPVYNHERPHEALGLAVPASRYRPSPRAYPEQLPSIEYGPGDKLRKVQSKGEISFEGRALRVPSALRGQTVALRPTAIDGHFNVYFCQHLLREIDLTQHASE